MWMIWHYISWLLFIVPVLLVVMIVRSFTAGRRGFRKGLQRDVPVWESKGLISREQGDGILKSYKLRRPDARHGMDMVKVLSVIGALFIGIGVIFFIGSNWQRIPAFAKTAILLGVTIFTLFAGYIFSYEKKGFENLGKSLLLLACLLWGGSVALIAQIYHMPVSDNWFVMWLWAFPILPVALFFRNTYVYVLSSLLFLIWNFLYGANTRQPNYIYPVISFAILLPFGREFTVGRRINIIGLIIAAITCCFVNQEWVALLISLGLLFYAFYKKEEVFYIHAATVSFLCWAITFHIARGPYPNLYFIAPLAALLYLSHKNKAGSNVVLALLAALVWLDLTIYSYSEMFRLGYGYYDFLIMQMILGAMIYVAGIRIKMRKDEFFILYKVFGFLACLVFTYLLTFNAGHYWQARVTPQFGVLAAFPLAVVLIGFTFAAKEGYFRSRVALLEFLGMGAVIAVVAFFMGLPDNLTANVFLANALLFSFALISIFLGIEVQMPAVFNGGVVIFAALLITRFIDIGWKMKEKSLFFIVGGIILLAMGIFVENRRRKIVERIKSS